MKKFVLLILLFISFNLQPIFSQCGIEQFFTNNNLNFTTSSVVGQSFQPCTFAVIDSVKVKINSLTMGTANLTFTLALGEGNNTNILHTQVVPVSSAGDITIPINQDILLDPDKTYTFNLAWSAPGAISFSTGGSGDMYNPDGNANTTRIYINGTGSGGGGDLYFAVYLGAEIIVPTMSQWGLIIFGLLLLNLGIIGLNQKERN